MSKKKLIFQTQIILKINKINNYNEELIKKSFKNNEYQQNLIRLSYRCLHYINLHYFNYFKSYQNLVCPISLSTKVPSSKYLYSRYFFNNQLSKLVTSNLIK